MPLTIEEQKELAELNNLAGDSPQVGLTNAEQQELTELDRLAEEKSGLGTGFISSNIPLKPGQQIPLGHQSNKSLLSQLGTKLPEPGGPRKIPIPFISSGPGANLFFMQAAEANERKRQENLLIVQELGFRGFTKRDVEERLDPTFFEQLKQDIGRTIGGTVGGIGGVVPGAAIGTAILPGPGTLIGGLAGAAIFAGLGKLPSDPAGSNMPLR